MKRDAGGQDFRAGLPDPARADMPAPPGCERPARVGAQRGGQFVMDQRVPTGTGVFGHGRRGYATNTNMARIAAALTELADITNPETPDMEDIS